MLNRPEEYPHEISRAFNLLTNLEENIPVFCLTFQVCDACNLRCTYCYQTDKQNNYMSFETAKTFIDYLFEHKDDPNFRYNMNIKPVLLVEFIGGEPLLNIKLIHQICDYFEDYFDKYPDYNWSKYHYYNITSNGITYFNKDVQDYLSVYKHFCSIGVTLDGCKECHDKCRLFPDGSPSYDLSLKAALDLKNKGQKGTKITLSPDNIEYTSKSVINMLELGFNIIHINPIFEQGWELKHALILLKEADTIIDYIEKNNLFDKIYIALFSNSNCKSYKVDNTNIYQPWCGAHSNMLALDYKGDIYPCIRFMESSLNGDKPPLIVGNIKHGLAYTEEEKKNADFIFDLKGRMDLPDKCINCSINDACPSCTGYVYQETGKVNTKTTHHCDMIKAQAIASLKLHYKFNKLQDIIGLQYLDYNDFKELISEEEFNKITGRRN